MYTYLQIMNESNMFKPTNRARPAKLDLNLIYMGNITYTFKIPSEVKSTEYTKLANSGKQFQVLGLNNIYSKSNYNTYMYKDNRHLKRQNEAYVQTCIQYPNI